MRPPVFRTTLAYAQAQKEIDKIIAALPKNYKGEILLDKKIFDILLKHTDDPERFKDRIPYFDDYILTK